MVFISPGKKNPQIPNFGISHKVEKVQTPSSGVATDQPNHLFDFLEESQQMLDPELEKTNKEYFGFLMSEPQQDEPAIDHQTPESVEKTKPITTLIDPVFNISAKIEGAVQKTSKIKIGEINVPLKKAKENGAKNSISIGYTRNKRGSIPSSHFKPSKM
jgi:hypothetical protein